MNKINIFSDKSFKVDKIKIKLLISEVLKLLSLELRKMEISFVSDLVLFKVNKQYLNHEYFTDIITFSYAMDSKVDCELLISYETALYNAKKYKTKLNSEIVRLIVHGILHVSGYDDKMKSDKIKMKKKENAFVKLLSTKYELVRQ